MIRNNDAGWGGPEFRGTCFETWNMKLHGTLSKKEGNLQGLLNGLPTKDLLLDIADRSTFLTPFDTNSLSPASSQVQLRIGISFLLRLLLIKLLRLAIRSYPSHVLPRPGDIFANQGTKSVVHREQN